MVFGKTVRILSWGQDKYDRTLGIVFTNECVNTKLVREGFAWHYRQYSDSKVLADAEVAARKGKKGLPEQKRNPGGQEDCGSEVWPLQSLLCKAGR